MEIITGGIIACTIMYAASNWRTTDATRIKRTFRNTGYSLKGSDGKPMAPRLLKRHRKDDYVEYVYSVPTGMIDKPELSVILEKTLGKPVSIRFKKRLFIRVYDEDLTDELSYDWDDESTSGSRWSVPFGKSLDGAVNHDFDRVPHMTIAGATRQGKTVLLKLILAHLIRNNPDDAEFYIVDLKGGLEFGKYGNLRQVKRVSSDIYEAKALFSEILAKVRRDMAEFKKNGYSNILDTDLRRRRFIIVDEGAELAPPAYATREEKAIYHYCQHAVSEICRIAGALGYRNIFCTQYPTADTLPRQVKQNSDAKVSFRLPTEVASRVAIDGSGAELLKRPGHAIYRTHEKHEIQVAYIKDADISEHLKGEFVDDGDDVSTHDQDEAGNFEGSARGTDFIEIG